MQRQDDLAIKAVELCSTKMAEKKQKQDTNEPELKTTTVPIFEKKKKKI